MSLRTRVWSTQFWPQFLGISKPSMFDAGHVLSLRAEVWAFAKLKLADVPLISLSSSVLAAVDVQCARTVNISEQLKEHLISSAFQLQGATSRSLRTRLGRSGSDVEIEISKEHGWYKMLQNMLRNCQRLLHCYRCTPLQRFNPRFLCNTAWALAVGASTLAFNFLIVSDLWQQGCPSIFSFLLSWNCQALKVESLALRH